MKAKNALQHAAQSNRRDFLRSGAAIATGLSAGMLTSASSGDVAAAKSTTADEPGPVQSLIPTRNLGKTGALVGIFGLIGCDSVEQVEACAELARSFTPLSRAQMAALEAKVEPIAKQALFFRRYQRQQP